MGRKERKLLEAWTRTISEIGEGDPGEQNEPPLCDCGKHYLGAPCPQHPKVIHNPVLGMIHRTERHELHLVIICSCGWESEDLDGQPWGVVDLVVEDHFREVGLT